MTLTPRSKTLLIANAILLALSLVLLLAATGVLLDRRAPGVANTPYFILWFLDLALLLSLAIWLLLSGSVLGRLTRLIASVQRLSAAGDLAARVDVMGSGELARLASAINEMLAALERAEQARRASETRFRVAAECASDLIYEWDIASGRLEWYGNVDAQLGYAPGEFPRTLEAWERIIHPEDHDRVMAAVQRHLTTRQPYYEEYRVRRQDGTFLYWADRGAALWDEAGVPQKWIGVNTDITERKWAEADLRRLKDFSEGIIQSMAEGIVVQNAAGDLTFVNPAAAAFLGYAPEELVGQHWTTIVPPDQQPIIQAADKRRAQGRADRYEVELIRKDGVRVPALISGSPRFEEGRFVGSLAVFTDISARVQAEAEREHLLLAERQQRQVAETLCQASITLTSALDPRQVLDDVLTHLDQVIPYDSACVFLLEGAYLRAVAGRGFPPEKQVVGQLYPVDAIFQELFHSQRPLRLPDAQADPRFQRWGGTHDIHGWMGVPLVARGETIGCLTLDSRRPNAYSEAQAALAQAFANQAAIALDNARLYQQERESRQRAEVLRQAAQAVGASLELSEILRLILEQLKRVLVYDTASVLIFREEDTPDLVVGVGYANEQMTLREARRLLTDSPLLRQMAADLQPIVCADVRQLDGWFWIPGAEHVRSFLGMPLVARGQMIGALMVDSAQPQAFGEADVQIAHALAQHAAQALDNARLFNQIRRLLDQTRDQARQVQQIIDTVPEGVLLLDANLRIQLTNPIAQEYLDALAPAQNPLTHLGGRPLAELLTVSPQGLWHEVTTSWLPRRTFEVAAQPMESGPDVDGWVLVLRDVTQNRESQQRAQQQERLAAVGQLAAGIAHDFNNILTGIIGYAQLLQRRHDLPEPIRERLALIVEQGFRAARLVRQILDFSRQSLSEKRPLNLVPFCKEIVKLLARTIPENIQIHFDYEPGEFLVNADPAQLQQVLMNLAVNARDAMPTGGRLEMKLAWLMVTPETPPPLPRMSAGLWIALSISDTGTGIAPEHMAHLFEPFFTTKEVGKGTGLGLAQAYGLITQHDGQIGVTSELGRGTTFTLYLPALAEEPAAEPELFEEEDARGQGETILLVEDEADVLEVSKVLLEQAGYRVLTATSGEEALQVYDLHAAEIVLVLTDLVMPQMGGTALFQALRARNPQVKMIVMSGYPMGEESKELLTSGVVDWLQKPIQMNQLMRVIHHALGR